MALLAAAGRSNRDIAEALHLSRRTVENYLHRAYDKLGITGRKDLGRGARRLTRHGSRARAALGASP